MATHAHPHPRLDVAHLRERQQRVLWWSLVLNGSVLVAQVIGGLLFGSLALLADAAHLLSDVAGLAIALVAHRLLSRPASDRHSFGLQRAEVLGAQGNGILLVAASGWIVVEALRRIGDAPHVEGGGLVAVASVGLLVNVVSAVALFRVRGESLNVQGAFVHMSVDAAGSVGAVLAGVAALGGVHWVDPLASLLIAALVVAAAWGLLRDSMHVLLEGTPPGVDPLEVAAAVAEVPGVAGVHHLHVWSLASDTPALSAHVVLEADPRLHEAQARGEEIRAVLHERFGIGHATLELECHVCEPEPTTGSPAIHEVQP